MNIYKLNPYDIDPFGDEELDYDCTEDNPCGECDVCLEEMNSFLCYCLACTSEKI